MDTKGMTQLDLVVRGRTPTDGCDSSPQPERNGVTLSHVDHSVKQLIGGARVGQHRPLSIKRLNNTDEITLINNQ